MKNKTMNAFLKAEGRAYFPKFMGATIDPPHPEGKIMYKIPIGLDGNYVRVNEANMCYHYSWDWLMPVVEKIIGMETFFKLEKDRYGKQIIVWMVNSTNLGITAESLFEKFYQSSLDFVKWYESKSRDGLRV